jgi:uncharacterized membrane protein
MKSESIIAVASLVSVSLCSTALAGGPPTYRVIKLNVVPKAGDGDAQATAIVEALEPAKNPWVSVQVATGEGLSRAVQCSPDNICVDPFPNLPVGASATAVDVNDRGRMIGVRQDPGEPPVGYSVRGTGGVTFFGSLKWACPEKHFIPQAVSSDDDVYGVAPDCSDDIRPVEIHKGNIREDRYIPPNAVAILYLDSEKTSKGGAATFADGHSEAFITWWHGNRVLGTLGGQNSVATAVRYSYAVGCSDTAVPGEQKAFWAGGPTGQEMTALPVFGDGSTCATGVTYKPVIVGNGLKSTQSRPPTTFYYREGVMYDLNDLLQESDRKYHILRVAGITPVGDIAATAVSDEDPRAVAVRLEVVKK